MLLQNGERCCEVSSAIHPAQSMPNARIQCLSDDAEGSVEDDSIIPRLTLLLEPSSRIFPEMAHATKKLVRYSFHLVHPSTQPHGPLLPRKRVDGDERRRRRLLFPNETLCLRAVRGRGAGRGPGEGQFALLSHIQYRTSLQDCGLARVSGCVQCRICIVILASSPRWNVGKRLSSLPKCGPPFPARSQATRSATLKDETSMTDGVVRPDMYRA